MISFSYLDNLNYKDVDALPPMLDLENPILEMVENRNSLINLFEVAKGSFIEDKIATIACGNCFLILCVTNIECSALLSCTLELNIL